MTAAAVGDDRTAPDSVAALLFPLYPFLNFVCKILSILYLFIYCLFFYYGFLYIIFPVCIKESFVYRSFE
nr:MAG TPA: hypothetical protein [Caudoviricetes sp.]